MNILYDVFHEKIIDLHELVNNVTVSLITELYTPDKHHRSYYNEVELYRCLGAQSLMLMNPFVWNDALHADPAKWQGSFAAHYVVLSYADRAEDDLIGCLDFGENKTTENGDFIIEWNRMGIITFPQIITDRLKGMQWNFES